MIDGVEIIDFHGHQGAWDFYGMCDDADRVVRVMDAAGIDLACVFNIFHANGRTAHEHLSTWLHRHPRRFLGFAYASVLCSDMVGPVRDAIDRLGCRAIKVYPHYGSVPLTDERWTPLLSFADERRLAVISHTGTEPSCEPKFMGEVAPRFPRVNFVVGHSGNVQPQRTQAIEAAQRWPNVYLETCSSYRSPNVIEDLVAGAGAEKVLYGSDLPLMDPRCQIGKIITARIGDDAKRLILGGNARRLLRL